MWGGDRVFGGGLSMFVGICRYVGQPEPLCGNLSGWWFHRANSEAYSEAYRVIEKGDDKFHQRRLATASTIFLFSSNCSLFTFTLCEATLSVPELIDTNGVPRAKATTPDVWKSLTS